MQLLDLAFMSRFAILVRSAIKSACRMLQQLLLPGVDLVGMDLIALSQIGNRRLVPERFQRNPRLQCRVDPPPRSLRHLSAPPQGTADYPIKPLVPKTGSTSVVGG